MLPLADMPAQTAMRMNGEACPGTELRAVPKGRPKAQRREHAWRARLAMSAGGGRVAQRAQAAADSGAKRQASTSMRGATCRRLGATIAVLTTAK